MTQKNSLSEKKKVSKEEEEEKKWHKSLGHDMTLFTHHPTQAHPHHRSFPLTETQERFSTPQSPRGRA
jgi:hypothetical protein